MKRHCSILPCLFALLLSASRAHASDGVIEINHTSAQAGGVTGADTPGYPVTITGPGSYRLTGALTPPAGSAGIVITGSQVTLDLNGFSIRGTAMCTGAPTTSCTAHGGSGILHSDFAAYGIVIRNGTIQGMDNGVDVVATASSVENVTAIANNGNGIFVNSYSSVRNSSAGRNRFTGIVVGTRCQILDSESHENGAEGFRAFDGGIVSRNRAYMNATSGIRVNPPALVDRNAVEQNNVTNSPQAAGIFTTNSSTTLRVRVEENVLRANLVGDIYWTGSATSPYFSSLTNVCTSTAC